MSQGSDHLEGVVPLRERCAHWLGTKGTALLRLLPAEAAHDVGMWLTRKGWLERLPAPHFLPTDVGLGTVVPGIGKLPHPVGLAAGFDKNCRAPRGFVRMGFAFLEIGTVTPRPQPGNPKPRLFRQPEQMAIINRMGFNSDGATTVAHRLRREQWQHEQVPLGINAGKNKDTPPPRALSDYVQVVETFKDLALYFVLNVSSPNTPGLRDLANPTFVRSLADELAGLLPRIWIKIDPDMDRKSFQRMVEVVMASGFQGMIISNTHRVTWPEVGGQSGHPLATQSSTCLEWAYEVHRGGLPMIASGGVLSGVDVFQRLARGACAVQIYTALVYRGPWTVLQMLEELAAEMRLRGLSSLDQVIGSHFDL